MELVLIEVMATIIMVIEDIIKAILATMGMITIMELIMFLQLQFMMEEVAIIMGIMAIMGIMDTMIMEDIMGITEDIMEILVDMMEEGIVAAAVEEVMLEEGAAMEEVADVEGEEEVTEEKIDKYNSFLFHLKSSLIDKIFPRLYLVTNFPSVQLLS